MYKGLIKYYLAVSIVIFGGIVLSDFWFQRYQPSKIKSYSELRLIRSMVEDYCHKSLCSTTELPPFEFINFLARDDVGFSSRIPSLVAKDEVIATQLESGEWMYYLRFTDSLILEVGPLNNMQQQNTIWPTLTFYSLLALSVLAILYPLFRDMWLIKEQTNEFVKHKDIRRFSLPQVRIFSGVVESLNLMIMKIARLLALQKELGDTLSHELRTNLSSLKFTLASLESDENKEELEWMRRDINEIEDLVYQYLNFSKQEHETASLQKESTDLGQMVTDCVEQFSRFNVKAVDIQLERQVIAQVDAKFLYRSVKNLIENGFKYSNDLLVIKLYSEDSNIVFQVHDDGDGLDIEKVDELFLPYTKLNQSAKGYGLGLAITKKIIEWHRGDLSARQSEVLSGACFQIKIPKH